MSLYDLRRHHSRRLSDIENGIRRKVLVICNILQWVRRGFDERTRAHPSYVGKGDCLLQSAEVSSREVRVVEYSTSLASHRMSPKSSSVRSELNMARASSSFG
jgi:hypothetical protein